MSDPSHKPADATELMAAAAQGDREAAGRLLPLVYDQLRRSAQAQMDSERSGHTLSATALVHEAYLKLAGPREVPWAGRAHFYAAAAEAMRRILVDHARSRKRRGGDHRPLAQIADVADLAGANPEQILAVDAAMDRLEEEAPEAAQLVRLRFFAGMGVDQAAEAMGLSPRSAARLWTFARAALFRYVGGT